MHNTHQLPIPWSEVEAALNTLQEVEGGHTHAHRGVITLRSGAKVFVKIGTDDSTKKWAAKEIETYRILARHGYAYAPSLLAANASNTAFAIDALAADDNWDWTDTWTRERLTATLTAMDALAGLALTANEQEYFSKSTINETQDGWKQLATDADAQRILIEKLQRVGREDIASKLNISEAANQSASFMFTRDTLVHNDIRADNAAWHPENMQVKLVDWNWTQLGDKRVDIGALLVNVQKAGLDVATNHTEYLDTDALHWLAGYWLKAATRPLWPGASEKSTLRDYQLSSGITALDLVQTLAEPQTSRL